jgi:NADH:ubiquinone oxidoreductase subunit 4 (subunit M)
MVRTLLLLVLFVSVLLEAALAGAAFFAPALLMDKFGLKYSPDLAFLTFVLAWLLLFVTLVALVAFWQVLKRRPNYAVLCYLLGLWWLGIGVGIFAMFRKPDNLLLDSLKGFFILVLTWRCQASRMATRRY